jgi:serine/threonine protein phosphatase PrpC
MIVFVQYPMQFLSLYAIFQHSALLDLDNDTAFFGVFDGHGGN